MYDRAFLKASTFTLMAGLFMTASTVARASNDTWVGGGGGFNNWGNAANWQADATPSPGDTLYFSTGSSLTLNNDLGDAITYAGLIQNSGAPGFTLTGDRTFVSGSIVNNSTNPFTLEFNNSFGEAMEITGSTEINAASGNIIIEPTSGGGVISLNFGTVTTFDAGAGHSVTISSNLNENGNKVVDSGLLILSGQNSSAGGATQINSTGTLQLQANSGNTTTGTSTALGTSSISIQNGATIQLRSDSSVNFSGASGFSGVGEATINFDVNQLTSGQTNNTLSFATGGFSTAQTVINVTGGNGYTLALGPINMVSYGDNSLTLNATTGNLSVSSITNGANGAINVTGSGNTTLGAITSGSGSLNQSGSGTLTVTAANSQTGATQVSSGALIMSNGSNGSATGTGALSVSASGAIGGAGTSLPSNYTIYGKVIVGNGTDATSSTVISAPTNASVNGLISGANLAFNLSSTSSNANLLNLGTTNVSFSGTTLTLNLLGNSIVSAYSPYTLITDSAGFNSSTDGLTTKNETINGVNYNVITGGLSILANSDFGTENANGLTSGFYNNSFLYIANGGDNIDVMVVPEPSTWAMMLGGLGVLIFVVRRRRRS